MKYNLGMVILVGLLGYLGYTMLKRQETEAKPIVQTPTIRKIAGGMEIAPAPGTAPVTPYPGAQPVQPQTVILLDDVHVNQYNQVRVYNPITNATAFTDIANLPNMVAGGWQIL